MLLLETIKALLDFEDLEQGFGTAADGKMQRHLAYQKRKQQGQSL